MVLSEYIAVHKAHTNLISFYTPRTFSEGPQVCYSELAIFFLYQAFVPLSFYLLLVKSSLIALET